MKLARKKQTNWYLVSGFSYFELKHKNARNDISCCYMLRRAFPLPKTRKTFASSEIIYNFKEKNFRKRQKIPNPPPNQHASNTSLEEIGSINNSFCISSVQIAIPMK